MPKTHEEVADDMIADCDGDPRAAVVALVKVNAMLMAELRDLTSKRAHERHPLATQ